MQKTFCDKCKKEIKRGKVYKVQIEPDFIARDDISLNDLCESCMKEIRELLK